MCKCSDNVAAMNTSGTDAFGAWVDSLEARCLADLEFPEVSRALRALSSAYVERRRVLRDGAALSGRGKRAAFALFYGPLHFLTVRHIVEQRSLGGALGWMIDLGCGTGAAGAAWATACSAPPHLIGVVRASVGGGRSSADVPPFPPRRGDSAG